MTRSDQIILQLIRKALNADCQIDQSLFKDANWTRVIDVAFEQGVAGICFDGIELLQAQRSDLPEEYFPDIDILMDWYGQTAIMEMDYSQHQKTIEELAGFYGQHNISMFLVKGYGLSLYWPIPNHRPIGDIDIFLQSTKLSAKCDTPIWRYADELLHNQLGINIDTGHEHHTTFLFKDTLVENHYDFINTKAHKDARRIESKLKELASRGRRKIKARAGNQERIVWLPSVDFNVLFLIRHLGQHFAGERITLRQLLDWGLFLKTDGKKVEWNKMAPFLKEIGIWTFFNQICAICEDYLGLQIFDKIGAGSRPEVDKGLEIRIVEDILHPEFSEAQPKKLFPVLIFKARRWWYNRWKHPMVYNEWLLPMFMTLFWSHLRRIETIKD